MRKNTKGFTLIEVIVVAVIVAVLAAVAIPLYNSYISSSRRNVVDNFAGSAATFCAAARDNSQTVVAQTVIGPAVLNDAGSVTKLQVPDGLTAVITLTQVTVSHAKEAGYTKVVQY